MARPVFYDIGSLAAGAKRQVAWPLAVSEVKSLNAKLQSGLVGLVRDEADADLQDILAIAAPAVLITLFSEAVVALTLERASQAGLAFQFSAVGLAHELSEGKADSSGRIYQLVKDRFTAATTLRWDTFARDFAHGAISNHGAWRGERHALVMNQNDMLKRTARMTASGRVRYVSPARIFSGELPAVELTMSQFLGEYGEAMSGLAAKVLNHFGSGLAPVHRSALAWTTSDWLATVATHRAYLERDWRAPVEMWTGTGGNYVSRQLRAAVRRNGGRVSGFEHGGGGHIHRSLGAEAINEFWLADTFVVDTKAKADVYSHALEQSSAFPEGKPSVVAAATGASPFAWRTTGRRTGVRRVLYVTTAFVGETCYPIQPLMPDPIYADWQGRLVDGLAHQGYEVLVKQHPGGLAKGKPLVMSSEGRYLTGSFEDAMNETDAFILDYPATTTLWEAICTDKPVLFLDFGLAEWNSQVRTLFELRCAVVYGNFDEANRPHVDFAEVRDALNTAPMDDAFAEAYLVGQSRR